jgi:ADP-heptose:LPS heptosyltransferase
VTSVFTTPLVHGLRQRFPDADLTYLVEPSAAPVVAHNPHLNDLVIVPYRRGLARLADDLTIAARLRRARFDIAIDLHGGPRSAWLTWASRAPMRIGYAIAGRTWMYTHVVPRSPDLTPRHSVANQWDLLSPTRDRAMRHPRAIQQRCATIQQSQRGWPKGFVAPASIITIRWRSCTSALAIRSAAGRRRHFGMWSSPWRGATRGAASC